MGPQNLNNYYFNKLDARLDYSSYYDIFLTSDERDYNREVVFSPYLICVGEHINEYLSGNTWCSDCLPLWIDLNNPESSRKLYPYTCTDYDENNTILSLPYWCSAEPSSGDTQCTCPKCENREFTGNTSFIESVCDVGLTGVDNGLVQYMSGNTTEYDACKLGFVSVSAFTSTISGDTNLGCVGRFLNIITGTVPDDVKIKLINGTIPINYPCSGSTDSVTSATTVFWDNFSSLQSGMTLSGCCYYVSGKDDDSGLYLSFNNFVSTFSGETFTVDLKTEKGYWEAPCQVESLKLWVDMPDQYKWDHLHYDRRFKMKQVTGLTHNYTYGIEGVSGGTEGYYNDLRGGFYQGFYKLYGYPYDVLPERPECGWTVESLLKYETKCLEGCTKKIISREFKPVFTALWTYTGCSGNQEFVTVEPDDPESGVTVCSINTPVCLSGSCGIVTPTTDTCYCGTNKTLNDTYPNNKGIYFYMGTRAENKFHNFYSGETGLNTCDQGDYSCSGIPTPIITTGYTGYCGTQVEVITSTYDEKIDSLSNALALRLTDDGRVGYRALYYTGSCITTYSEKKVLDCETNEYYTIEDCVTGLTYSSGYTIIEKYSNVVCGLTGSTFANSCPWLLVSARFQRDYCYDGCDLENEGGVNDLIDIPIMDTPGYIDSGLNTTSTTLVREAPLMPGWQDRGNKVVVTGQYLGSGEIATGCTTTECCTGCTETSCTTCGPATGCTTNYTKLTEKIRFTKKWSDQRFLRKGTLTLFVNGRPVLTDTDFEEIIPRQLNTEKQKQVGVPFNMSWGGGTQGLIENQTFSADTSGNTITCPPYTQDPADLGLLIEKNFAGTYIGGISQLRYYIRPLGVDEIFHNFLVNKDRYDLVDCGGGCTNGCGPCPAIIVRDCDSLDLILDFAVNQTITSVNNLSEFIILPEYVSARFTGVLVDNVVSYVIEVIPNSGTGTPTTVTTPFLTGPDDVIKVTIVKFDSTKESKVTIIGNLTK